jgi:CubicO group peptidase (beta-lactamase class C family)
MLVEEGKVRLTDSAGRFIPELETLMVAVPNTAGLIAPAPSGAVVAPQPWHTVQAERPIMVRDLLAHTSGLASGGASNASPVTIGAGETLAQVLLRLRNVEVASGMPFDRFVQQRIFAPLGMQDTFFYRDGTDARRATLYQHVNGALTKQAPGPFVNGAYFSGGGGLTSTAEDYLRFALMLMNGGEVEGTRLLSRRTVELMASAFAPDTLPGRNPGEGYGLGVRVVTNSTARNTMLSEGSFGWAGAFNTYFFIDPREKVVAMFLTQVANLQSRGEIRNDFDTAVMQAITGD